MSIDYAFPDIRTTELYLMPDFQVQLLWESVVNPEICIVYYQKSMLQV